MPTPSIGLHEGSKTISKPKRSNIIVGNGLKMSWHELILVCALSISKFNNPIVNEIPSQSVRAALNQCQP